MLSTAPPVCKQAKQAPLQAQEVKVQDAQEDGEFPEVSQGTGLPH
jgi:hypothetical protein